MPEKQTDLKTLVADLAANMKRAAIDLEAVPYQTKSSMANAKAEAAERVVKLKEQYVRQTRSNSLGVFIFGDPDRVAAFTPLAADSFGLFTVQADLMYSRLAKKIEVSLGTSREFGPTQLQGLIEGLRDLNQSMGVRTMVMPGLREITASRNLAELTQYVRKLVKSAVDDDLLRMYVDQQVNEIAINQKFSGNTLTVAVSGVTREEYPVIAGLFTTNLTVEVGTTEDGEVDQQFVSNRLEGVRNALRAKNSSN